MVQNIYISIESFSFSYRIVTRKSPLILETMTRLADVTYIACHASFVEESRKHSTVTDDS